MRTIIRHILRDNYNPQHHHTDVVAKSVDRLYGPVLHYLNNPQEPHPLDIYRVKVLFEQIRQTLAEPHAQIAIEMGMGEEQYKS